MKNFKKTVLLITVLFTFNLSAQEAFEVRKTGKGQPVLLFPGFTCTGDVWQEIENELAEKYELHIFTFAGFGGVEPVEFPWLPKIKTGIENYVQDNNLQNAVIIGHSLGGSLGLWLTSENPETFSKIIVVDALPAMGALLIPDYKSENIIYNSPYNEELLRMEEEEFATMARQMASSMTTDREKQSQLSKWIAAADRKTYVYGYTDLLKLDLREELSEIQIPVSILAATQPYGKETAEKNYRRQYEKLGSYTLDFAENSGHFIMYDQPEWFLEMIKFELEVR